MVEDIYEINLLNALKSSFSNDVKPTHFYDVSDHFRQQYEQEFSALEDLDWKSASPKKLLTIYEPNTFLSVEAYKFLVPHIFSYCLKYRDSVPPVDLVSVFFYLPLGDGQIGNFHGYSKEQKKLFWKMFTYLNFTLDFDFLDKVESSRLRLKLDLDYPNG